MSYSIIWGRRAARQAKKLNPQVRGIVKQKVDELLEDPYKYSLLSGSLSPLRSMRISTPGGEYRVAYSIDEEQQIIGVIFVGPRENFYKEEVPRIEKE